MTGPAPTPPLMTGSPPPPTTGPAAAPPPAPAQKSVMPPTLLWGLIAGVLVLLGLIGLLMMKPRVAPALPVPTPTPVQPTPTPIQLLSPLATQSAFLQFSSSVASLSAAVTANSTQDQTLTPPVLTLPLGF